MKTVRILQTFKKYTPEALVAFCELVILCLTNNAYFTKLQADLPDFTDMVAAFKASVQLAVHGTPSQKATRNQLRLQLLPAIVLLADKVMVEANGNRAILLTTSFELSKETPAHTVLKLNLFKAAVGKMAGTVDLEVKADGAVSYYYYFTPLPVTADSKWEKDNCTDKKCTIKDLVPGQPYAFKVQLTGTRKQSIESQPVTATAMVQ